jgi:predicted nucleic acid-binding protein
MMVVTLDAGALIAMERKKERGMMLLRAAQEHRAELIATTATIAEWWRGNSDVRNRIKQSVTIVSFPLVAAEAAGVALGQFKGVRVSSKLTLDVMVMAFAATLGGSLVYTSDMDDLESLQPYFPSVRLLGV